MVKVVAQPNASQHGGHVGPGSVGHCHFAQLLRVNPCQELFETCNWFQVTCTRSWQQLGKELRSSVSCVCTCA